IDGEFKGDDSEFKGNTFRLTPDNAFSMGLNYTMTTDFGSVFFTPSYSWKSRIYFTEDPNDIALSQDSYGLLNLRAGLNRGRWQIAVFVKNALDEDYLIDAGNTGANFGLPTFIAGPPRL